MAGKHKHISRYWLLLGVFALAIAGLYSLTLVIGRTPGLSDNLEIQRIFKDALVVHVDLSVLVWFLSIACLFWSTLAKNHKHALPLLEEAALICFGLCILFMMASPADPKAVAMMSNYIPTISSPIFMLSLAFLLCGVGFMLVKLFTSKLEGFNAPIRFGIYSAGIIALISITCFIWSYFLMPRVIEGEQYFDLLFWGGGHVLQFTHTQIVMVVWLLIAASLRCKIPGNNMLYGLFAIGLLAAFASPIAYLLYDVTSMEFRQFFTHKMIAIGGLAPGILALLSLHQLWNKRAERKGSKRALWSCTLVSALLFLYGGFLGLLIQGQNVVIPAHYHGSIVAITLAFMGFAYLKLPEFGYRDVGNWRLAYWQPIIYGIGQVMHISGLAYSGGYGVLRKTAGHTEALALNVKIALGIMGFGGLLAIAGGLMFVIVVYRAIKR